MNRMKMFIASGAMAMSLLVCGISSQAAPGASTVSVKADKPSTQSGTTGSKVSRKATVSNKKYKCWSMTGIYTGEWSNSMPNGKGTFTFSTETFDGVIQSDNWVDGDVCGQTSAQLVYENGDTYTYDGIFSEGLILESGTKVVEYENGDCYASVGTYATNEVLIEGEYMYMRSNETYEYCDGKYSDSGVIKSGYKKILNLNGTMNVYDGTYDSYGNLYDGEYVVYNSDSSVQSSGKYISGIKDADKYAADLFHTTGDVLREEHPYWALFFDMCGDSFTE